MTTQITKGECEFCGSLDVELIQVRQKDMMCRDCRAKELAVQIPSFNQLIETSRKSDAAIELDKDVMNAKTVAFVELQAAINHDESIPEDQKKSVLAREATLKFDVLDKAIFEKEAELHAMRNERAMWHVNIQNLVATLRKEEQAKYPKFSVNYPVKSPKSVKPAKDRPAPSNPAKQAKEAIEAIKTYGLKDVISGSKLQTLAVQRGVSPVVIAKEWAELLKTQTN